MLVTVNRIVVPENQIRREAAFVEAGTVAQKHAEAARTLAIAELLRQRAETLGIATEGRLDRAIDELLERELDLPEADEDACRRYFEANRERFCTPVEAELRHVLLAAPPEDAAARADQRERANAMLAALRETPSDFEALAREHSDCPSAATGGRLGVIGRSQTVPELETVVLRLPVGLAERPVESRYGFHVVEVLARAGGEPLAYTDVRSMIVEYLGEASWRRAVSQYVGQLAAAAQLRGVDIDAPDSLLMQ